MRHFLAAVIVVSVLLSSLNAAPAQPSARPNIVLIIADDMAWDDCGAYGHPSIRTPSIDRLAKEGMRFDRAYLTCSSCSPSRSSIITGRYPHNTGAHQLHLPLPADQVTFVELLKASGYWTGQAGKWHLGGPTKAKFDLLREGGEPSGCTNWVPLLQQRPKDKPFFVWLAASDPHRAYTPNTIPDPHKPENAAVPPYLPDVPETRADLAVYYDEIARLDGFIGKVMDELQSQGVADNTLVLFISDNGRPFPRCKTTVYESGVKTPFIVRWPGRVKPGSTCASLVSSIDIAPTFLELGGLKPTPTFQGVSLLPLLGDPERAVRQYAHSEHNWHDFEDHGRSVRSTEHLYIRNHYTDVPGTPPADAVRSPTFQAMRQLRDQKKLNTGQLNPFLTPRPAEELYHIDGDPHNLRNLADDPAYASILTRMRGEMERWTKETADSVPALRRADEFDRETGKGLPKKSNP